MRHTDAMPSGSKLPVGPFARHIAGALRAEAARQQVSQTELANATGISQSQVSKFLSGKTAPNVDELDALARALGRSYVDITAEADAELLRTTASAADLPGASGAEKKDLLRAIERSRPKRKSKRDPEAQTGS